MGDIYYDIFLYNYINNNKIHYNRKTTNCIIWLKIIEENYEKTSCKTKVIKYINRLFQDNYKIKDIKSIEIIYDNKELYYYENNLGNKFHNNIKLKIKENFGQIYGFNNNGNINNSRKIKDNNRNGKIKNNNYKFKFIISKGFKKYLEKINFLKENLCINATGNKGYYFANKIRDEESSIANRTIYKNFSNIDGEYSIADRTMHENYSNIDFDIKINI